MGKPYIIYCADPLEPSEVDPVFQHETFVSDTMGFGTLLIDHEAIDREVNVARALRWVKDVEPGPAIYRGWMVSADAYGALYDGLLQRGIRLITTPQQYRLTHHLPEAYPYVAPWTVETRWLDRSKIGDRDALTSLIATFDGQAIVVKDWVKSQASGYWDTACLIPPSLGFERALETIDRLIQLQGTSLTGGIVLRKYVPLAKERGQTEEWRAFIVDGVVIDCSPRFQAPDTALPPASLLKEIAAVLPSPFFTADVARTEEGKWILLEVGDGQVSEFPPICAPGKVFEALAARS